MDSERCENTFKAAVLEEGSGKTFIPASEDAKGLMTPVKHLHAESTGGLAWVMGVPPEVREPWGSWKARRDRTMPSDVKNRMWSWSITCITSSMESSSRSRAPALPAATQQAGCSSH